jgi:hypothetical protein
LAELSPTFAGLYAPHDSPSIPPEQLLRALLLQAFYSIRSERQLMERLDFDLLFRWFVGLRSAIDGRTTRHAGYARTQRAQKRIEEAFGWIKTIAGPARTRLRGVERVHSGSGRLQPHPPAQADRSDAMILPRRVKISSACSALRQDRLATTCCPTAGSRLMILAAAPPPPPLRSSTICEEVFDGKHSPSFPKSLPRRSQYGS